MSILKHFRAVIDEFRYAGVPPALPIRPMKRSQAQRGELGPNALAWCDLKLGVFKTCREQAENARGTTTAVVQVN